MDDPEKTEAAKTERWAWIAWGMLVVLGIAAFELLHQPALLGATISLKFAWGDARTGWWLRSRDPNRRRGLAHFWIYLGYGLWKAAICGFALTFVFIWIDQAVNGRPLNRPQNQRNETLTLLFAGSCLGSAFSALLSGAACCAGFWFALRNGVKLWLNSSLAACRVHDRWPPFGGDGNHLKRIVLPSALMGVATLIGGAYLAVALAVVGVNNALPPWLSMAGFLSAMFGLPVFGLVLNDWLKRRLSADDADDAWPDGEPSIGA